MPTATIPNWDAIRSRRGSTTSVSAPAGIVSRNIGAMVETCTADTIRGFGLRLVISQLEAVSNIAAPTADTELAIRMTVKATLANTPQRDGWDVEGPGVEVAWLVTFGPHSTAPPVLRRLRAFGNRGGSGLVGRQFRNSACTSTRHARA